MIKVPMTVGGFEKLKEELRWRQQEERPQIIEAISEAAHMATCPRMPNITPPRRPRA